MKKHMFYAIASMINLLAAVFFVTYKTKVQFNEDMSFGLELSLYVLLLFVGVVSFKTCQTTYTYLRQSKQ